MSFTLLYLLIIAAVGWGAGAKTAILLAALAAVNLFVQEELTGRPPFNQVTLIWNNVTRLLIFCFAAWLSAEVTRLTRHLARSVEERTRALEAEIVERKRNEATLRQQEEQRRTLLETATDGIVILDHTGHITEANDAYSRMIGYSRTELLGRHVRDLEARETPEQVAAHLEKLGGSGGDRFETGHRHKDGRTVEIEVSISRPKGQKGPYIGFIRDISGRKRSEALLEAQRDVATRLNTTSDLKVALDRLLEITVGLEGIDCAGVYLIDTRTGEFKLASYRGSLSARFVHHVSHYPPDSREAQFYFRNRPLYANYLEQADFRDPIRDAEGIKGVAVLPLCHEHQVLGGLNVASFTREQVPADTRVLLEAIAAQAAGAIARIRAEEGFRLSEARLRTTIAGAPIIIFAVNREGIITFEEGQALGLLGWSSARNVGLSVAEAFKGTPVVLDHMRRAMAGEEFREVLELGGTTLECLYSPTRNAAGEVDGYIGVATDITERLRLERQILEISDREQARIGQEIHDGLCQRLVSLAFDANALERELSLTQHSQRPIAQRLAQELDAAITEARLLSHGLFPVRLEQDGLASALEHLARATTERFDVDCRFTSSGPTVVPSPTFATHIYRIAQEAVNNALRHSGATSIGISLRADSGKLNLLVQDDGSGFRQDGQDSLDHCGMGLHIMEYRAHALGGQLRWESSVTGTTISCCLPCPIS